MSIKGTNSIQASFVDLNFGIVVAVDLEQHRHLYWLCWGMHLNIVKKSSAAAGWIGIHSCAPVSFVFCTAHHSPQRFSISLLLYFCKWNKNWPWLSFVYLETSSQKLSYFRDFKFEDIHNDSLKYLETKIFILREFNIMIISFIEPITWWLQYQISKRCPAHHPSTSTSAPASGFIFGDFLSL